MASRRLPSTPTKGAHDDDVQLRGLPTPHQRRAVGDLSRHRRAARARSIRLFVSVTYGAGGSDRQRSFDAIRTVADTGAVVAGHLTCVGQSSATSSRCSTATRALGVEHVVALRGDPPEGVGAAYAPHPDGYQRTADLVAAVKARGTFDVAVSAYPERHPQSPSIDHDLDVLAEKVAAGADRAITQMFFDNELFLRYRDRLAATRHRHPARARRVPDPLVPGRRPLRRPVRGDDPEHASPSASPGSTTTATPRTRVAADLAAEQIAELAAHGVEHVHLYTLNRAELVLAVVRATRRRRSRCAS